MKYIISIVFLRFMLFLILVSTLALGILGCSGFIYHPSRNLYVDINEVKPTPLTKTLSTNDGLDIFGWRIAHPESNKCILYFHGNGQNRSAHFLNLHWLVAKGYALYIFDYPGYGQTKGQPTPSTTVEAAKNILTFYYEEQCSKHIVYGHSLGGQIAMRAIWELQTENKPNALFIDSSFLSYQKVGSLILKKSLWTWLFQPLAYLVLSDKYAIGEKISEIKKLPIVVIHTKTDEVIPYSLGEEIFKLANEPKEFWVKEQGSHNSIYQGKEGSELKARLLRKLESL